MSRGAEANERKHEVLEAFWELICACDNQRSITPFGGLLMRRIDEAKEVFRRHALREGKFRALAGCPFGDPQCPCPDGDTCHYEGKDPFSAPRKNKVQP